MLSVLIRSVIIASVFAQGSCSQLKRLQQNHKGRELSNAEIRYLAGLSNTKYTNDILDNILIPRVVGTSNHEKVFNYIKKELQKLDWAIQVDEFEDKTPNFGKLTFKNIIATLNPNADRYLVLACHYDSKYFKNEVFVGRYIRLTVAEDRLDNLKLLRKSKNERYFVKRAFRAHIEDDHIPFLRKNVPVLHLISNPFPDEWHTPGDNRDIVDMNTVENINKILRVFVAEYLNVYTLDEAEENIPEKEL
ncbi:hypothetical protein NQ318_015947 [Aromia moschata]|uniref:glutaminyl-peptide cyclotransferase n=1 Tax=Aromia moschata TaxID=1265417 RepID=A0AAV8XQZ2_9CUCU|nr:hypothetical protein NQ318_015947 [Aromia moschata]